MRAITLRAALPRISSLLLGTITLCTALPAAALPAKRAASSARATLSLEEIAIMVASSDEDEVRSALEAAALLPAADVLPILEERIRQGLPRVLLDVAIDSVLLLGDRTALPLLRDLSRHRRPEIRVRALEALARLKAPDAADHLVSALGDMNPEVRVAAAQGLGELGIAGTTHALEKALKREIDGSARALGRIARPDQVSELLAFVGQAPLPTLTPMFEALMTRRDVPESEKLRVADKLATLADDDSRAAAAKLLEQLPKASSARLRQALTQAAQAGAKKDEQHE